jgi:hypothetical protein
MRRRDCESSTHSYGIAAVVERALATHSGAGGLGSSDFMLWPARGRAPELHDTLLRQL